MIIAVDGVSGSGKSTISKELAEKFGFNFLSTGMFYRAITLNAIELGVRYDQEDRVSDMLLNVHLRLTRQSTGKTFVVLNGDDVTGHLYDPQVNFHVADYAKIPKVRKFVQELQYFEAEKSKDIVVEGRDIGSVVFPNADLKIFLTCDVEERARRRVLQMKKNGKTPRFSDVLGNLIKRDLEDKNREISPLVVPKDAIVVDTTFLSKEETLELISKEVKQKLAQDIFEQAIKPKCLSKETSLKIETQKFKKPMCHCVKVYTEKDFGL